MKKLFKSFVIGAAALLCVSYGQESFAGEITGGIRGIFTMNLGTKEQDMAEYKTLLGGGAALYVNFGIGQMGSGMFGVQPEVCLYLHNGIEAKDKAAFNTKYKVTANSIDIPVLFTYTMPISSIKLGFGVGPYISIPYGIEGEIEGIKILYGIDKLKFNRDGTPLGLAFDVNCGFNMGPGALVIDIRYLWDIGKTAGKALGESGSVFKRRSLAIGLGYEMKF